MSYLQTYATETWDLIAEMSPYLIVGFLVAGALHRWIREEWIEARLGKPGFRSIVLGSLVGVPMPLCSCGVIPVTASLRDKGASKGAAASFLTSTPQTGLDSIFATYGMLGPVFAAYRVIVAFLSGLAVGGLIEAFGKADPPRPAKGPASETTPHPTWGQSFHYGLIRMPADIAGSLTIGFLIAGLISALAPDNLLANLPGGVYTSIVLTTLVATPFYICSTGSIPLALALIDTGLPVAAALVLLIAGPATNVATIATMRKTLGGRETILYVGALILWSWIAALVFHSFLDTEALHSGHAHEMGPSLWNHVAGGAFLSLLAYAYWSQNRRPKSACCSDDGNDSSIEKDLEEALLSIKGMNCSHCSESVRKGLTRLPFTRKVEVDLKAGQARLSGNGLDRDAVAQTLDSLGFALADYTLQKRESSQ